MGKVRVKVRPGLKNRPGLGGGGADHNNTVSSTVGKISEDISAISLGPPRTKCLKRTQQQSSTASGSSLTANFASRVIANSQNANKQKKKVTFCQNLIKEELNKKTSAEGEDAKHYFKVVHPSAIGRLKKEAEHSESIAARINSLIPEKDVLLSTSAQGLRKIIKKNVKNKKTRLRARKESFKKSKSESFICQTWNF